MQNILKKFGPILNIEFDKFFVGQFLSHYADAIIQFTVIAMLVSTLQEAGKFMALLFFVFMLPQFLLSPIFGWVGDKFERKKVLAAAGLFRAALVLALAFTAAGGGLTTNVALIYAFFIGCGAAIFYPAQMAIF